MPSACRVVDHPTFLESAFCLRVDKSRGEEMVPVFDDTRPEAVHAPIIVVELARVDAARSAPRWTRRAVLARRRRVGGVQAVKVVLEDDLVGLPFLGFLASALGEVFLVLGGRAGQIAAI